MLVVDPGHPLRDEGKGRAASARHGGQVRSYIAFQRGGP